MDIVVQLRSELAQLIHRADSSLRKAAAGNAELSSLTATLAEFDAELIPQHPGVDDAQLQSWFKVPCGARDAAACARLERMLQQDAAVESAFLKADAYLAAPM